MTPSNGLLTFERFCAGLKICLLRNQVESRQSHQSSEGQPVRPPSAPILDTDKPHWNSSNTATVRSDNYSYGFNFSDRVQYLMQFSLIVLVFYFSNRSV